MLFRSLISFSLLFLLSFRARADLIVKEFVRDGETLLMVVYQPARGYSESFGRNEVSIKSPKIQKAEKLFIELYEKSVLALYESRDRYTGEEEMNALRSIESPEDGRSYLMMVVKKNDPSDVLATFRVSYPKSESGIALENTPWARQVLINNQVESSKNFEGLKAEDLKLQEFWPSTYNPEGKLPLELRLNIDLPQEPLPLSSEEDFSKLNDLILSEQIGTLSKEEISLVNNHLVPHRGGLFGTRFPYGNSEIKNFNIKKGYSNLLPCIYHAAEEFFLTRDGVGTLDGSPYTPRVSPKRYFLETDDKANVVFQKLYGFEPYLELEEYLPGKFRVNTDPESIFKRVYILQADREKWLTGIRNATKRPGYQALIESFNSGPGQVWAHEETDQIIKLLSLNNCDKNFQGTD
ncbi:MAG: hypothetical protein ACOYL6_18035 [Bacteriovoracaceae bacterium]